MRNFLKLLILLTFFVSIFYQAAYADNLTDGVAALKRNDLGSALQLLSKSVQEDRTDPKRLYYLAVALKNMGEKARARRAYEAALKLSPSSDLARKINFDLKRLSSSKPTVSLSTSSKVLKIKQSSRRPNYLEHVTRGGKIFRWDSSKMPLKVYIAPGNNIPGFNSEYREKVLTAMKRWQSALRGKVSFVTTRSPDNADIKVDWLVKFAGHRIGESPFVSLGNTIVRSDVNLSTLMPDGRPKSPDELYAVVLHEIGHVLGIQGHSPYKDDVMYYSLNEDNYNGELTERDINTIKMLYKLEADVSNNLPLSMAESKEFYKLQLQAQKFDTLEDYKSALDLYLKANKLYDKEFINNNNIGICYLNLKDYGNAIGYLEKAVDLDPDSTSSKYHLAVAQVGYVNSLPPNEASAAIDYYRKALANLESIANKPDKPPNIHKFIKELQDVVNQYK